VKRRPRYPAIRKEKYPKGMCRAVGQPESIIRTRRVAATGFCVRRCRALQIVKGETSSLRA